ncbi:MAG: hypothetical protein R3F37_10315 [Candidatus Competibacteraceae bacterium]
MPLFLQTRLLRVLGRCSPSAAKRRYRCRSCHQRHSPGLATLR